MRRIGALTAGVLVAGAAVLAPVTPAAAAGGTMSASGTTVTITGSDGAEVVGLATDCASPSQCVVSTAESMYGPGEPLSAGVGCDVDALGYVHCSVPGVPTVVANLGGGDDVFDVLLSENTGVTLTLTVDGGAGNDVLLGGGEKETWYGGEGNDEIYPDIWTAIDEPPGSDHVSGGPGIDMVDGGGSVESGGVNISLDGVANDTHPLVGDVDNVMPDFEIVVGSMDDDILIGNDSAQTLKSYAGNDILKGGGGNDTLIAGAGNDSIDGGPGIDTINGDTAGRLESVGDDTIAADDGEADVVDCGPGSDAVVADDIDQISSQSDSACEGITLKPTATPTPQPEQPTPTPTPTPEPTPPPAADAAVASVAGKVVDANKRRTKASVKVACTVGAAACTGKLSVKAGKTKVGTGTFTVEAGSTGKAKVKLTRKAKALLRRSAKVKVKVVLVQGSGKSTVRGRLTR